MTEAATRPVRHLAAPRSRAERVHRLRYTLARRMVQLGVLALFIGTVHWGWTLFGQPLLPGNLSAARFVGAVPLADPFMTLQMLVAGHPLIAEVLLGAGIVLVAYLLLGGRTWCGWVCPLGVVTDAAAWLRAKLGLRDLVRPPPRMRYAVLLLALVLSALTGVAAFEWISPIGILHRELVYGVGLGMTAVAGVFLLDVAVMSHGWCGHLCPLGAFWSVVGRAGQLRIGYDAASCTRCGDCVKACPEPQVLNLNDAARRGMVASGECLNCGRCIAVCPEDSLRFALRARIARPALSESPSIPKGSQP